MNKKLSILICIASLAGCTPIVELSHTSHISQHFKDNGYRCGDHAQCGWNVASAGIRLRPTKGVTIDIIDGYSVESVDGRHEVFQARMLWEIKP